MDMKLSHKLLDLGFFSALGTSEKAGISQNGDHIKANKPNTFDSNNGVLVIYDELGRPWIIDMFTAQGAELREEISTLTRQHSLQRGAYVPHSNDGGSFVQNVLPTLMDA